jgi:hypothetical protein
MTSSKPTGVCVWCDARVPYAPLSGVHKNGRCIKPAKTAKPAGPVAKAVAELEKAAASWEDRAMTYGLDKDLKTYLRSKAESARREAAKLRGEPVEPKPVAKTRYVVVSR